MPKNAKSSKQKNEEKNIEPVSNAANKVQNQTKNGNNKKQITI